MKSQAVLVALVACMACTSQAKPVESEASVSAVIPSPNQQFGDEMDLQRMGVAPAPALRGAAFKPMMAINAQQHAEPSNEASVPIYVSPFNRAQRGATIASPMAPSSYEQRQESSHAPPNYAPSPAVSASSDDLKTSASYGHHHHGGHYGHDHSGWLDMGAWTGGKGSFGWYADYPVGGKHYAYGRK